MSTVATGTEVTWDAPLFDGGSSSLTYRVYRGSSLLATGLTEKSFVDTSIGTSAATASYTVTAVNEAGESAHSMDGCLIFEFPFISAFDCAALAVELVFWVVGQLPVP